MRGKICGVGINDAGYVVNQTINGKRKMCPYYCTWAHMIKRCYMDDAKRRPGIETPYIGCSVVEEWHKFSVFKSWMETQDWRGKCLDKDLKVYGNKVYGPDTCIFITQDINKLISEGRNSSMGLKKGIIMDHGRYRARIRKYGKLYQIGNFDKEDDAHTAWVDARKKYLREVAENSNEELKTMILNWMECEFK